MLRTDGDQDYREECVYATRSRQMTGRSKQATRSVQDNFFRVEYLLPNQTTSPPRVAPTSARSEITSQPLAIPLATHPNPDSRAPERFGHGISRPQAFSPALNQSSESVLRREPSLKPPQPVDRPGPSTAIQAISPTKSHSSAQVLSAPSLANTSYQVEDDGTCPLPPEEQVSSLRRIRIPRLRSQR